MLAQELVEDVRPEKDRVVFLQCLVTLYVRYVRIFRQLEEAYDQMVHPQKRRVVRDVLDGVMGRVLELKNEMVEMEFSEYHYMDDVIQDMKLIPEDLEIPIPRYFRNEQNEVLQDREMLLNALKLKKGEERPPAPEVHLLSLEEAIKHIQVSERARQGRLRAKFMREIRRDAERQRRAKDRDLGPDIITRAALNIQKALGSAHSQPNSSLLAAQRNEVSRRQKQIQNEEDFQTAIKTVTEQLRDVDGPEIKETMKDQIRQWFIECRDRTGTFPDYPDEEEGGSAVIFSSTTPEQMAEELTVKEEEEDSRKPKAKEDKKDKATNKGEEEEEPGLKMMPSAFLPDLDIGQKTFSSIWQNRNESTNFGQRHETELIKEDKRKEIEAEIRLQVDELMRQELATWKLAVDRDKGGKTKGKAKKKKGSKSGRKKKKEKDLTPDRSIQSLFQELVEQGLLKQAEAINLKDYLGDFSYLGTTLRQTDIEPMPSLSDVRQVIALYAVLPLGSQALHEKAPLVKAILLAGPAGVGKKMLVHAICQETGSNLFDLSPLNLTGKYPGKSGLQMMLHLVFKVARLMQPSVVWIGDAEKMFYKKVPKEEKELDPKRLKKDLPKILKSIKGEDRVLIVGTTQEPFNADIKSLCKLYSKIILIPRPDYASRYVMWKQLILKNGGEVTNMLDLSSLAKISDGYTQGRMVQVVQSVLTDHRIQQLSKRPLTASEFVKPLARGDPVFQDEEEAFKDWYAKTPQGKKRAKAATGKDASEEETQKKDKSAKKKK
ncbi:hypothetical protein GJAV_G00069570 [Gymnothorax javanicus]|nr:hypothetical protein GJAV_G00069570 [Gymnothorax javanicus]